MNAAIELLPQAAAPASSSQRTALPRDLASGIDRWMALDSAWLDDLSRDDVWRDDPSRDDPSRDDAASLDRETVPSFHESAPVPLPRTHDASGPPTTAAAEPQTVFAVVTAWRAAQRTLDRLAEGSPEWNDVHAELVGLRALHHRLFDARLLADAGHGDGPARPTLTMMAWGPTWMPGRGTS
jgi:hypothetical protein